MMNSEPHDNEQNDIRAVKGVSFAALLNKIHGQIDSADRSGFIRHTIISYTQYF